MEVQAMGFREASRMTVEVLAPAWSLLEARGLLCRRRQARIADEEGELDG